MQNLLKFLIRIIDIILYLILVFVCIFFIYKTSAYRQWALNGFSKEVCGPLLRLQSNIEQYTSLKQENADLLAQNEQLMSMIAHQNMDMANDLEDSAMYDFIHARVIENTISKRNNVIILNKGSKAGIQPDMGVISPQGIVGIVKDVSPNFSIVLSLLNENFSVSAKDKRTETVGMITWNGKNYKYAQIPTETNFLSFNGDIKDNNSKNDNDNKKQKNKQNNNNKFNEIVLFNNKMKFRNSNKNQNKYRAKNNINEKSSNTYINKNLLSLDNNITNFGYTINLNIQNNNIFNNQDNNFNIRKNNKKKKLNLIPNNSKPTNIYNNFNNKISRNKSHLRNYKTALRHLFIDLKMVNKINNNDFLMPKIISISRNKKSSFSKENNSATITNFQNKNKSNNNNNIIKRNANQLLTNNPHYHSGSHDENKNNFSLSPEYIGKIMNTKDKKLHFINNNILKIDYLLEKKNKKNKFILTSTFGNSNNDNSRNNTQRINFAPGFRTEVNTMQNNINDNLSAVFKNGINKNEKNNNKYAFNLKLKDKHKIYYNNTEQSKPFNNSNNLYSKSKNIKKSKISDKNK